MKRYLLVFLTVMLLFTDSVIFSQISRLDYNSYRTYSRPSLPPFIKTTESIPPEIRNKNSFRRVEWFFGIRLNENGFYPSEFIREQSEKEMSKYSSVSDNPDYTWTNIGPVGIDMSRTEVPHWGVNSGRVRGMAIHPSNPDIVYIGAASGGIWKTTNGGQSWTDKSGTLNRITFGSIAIDNNNPNIIYAATGESTWYIMYNIYDGDGLYKSTDAGEHWSKITNDFGNVTHFSAIAISPLNSNLLIAAVAVSSLNPYPNQGIWRSTNAGVNWTRVVNITGAFDVAFHPSNPNIVYAVTGNKQQAGGFLVSTDAGLTFNQSNNGLPVYTSMGRLQFDICKTNPSVMYVLVHDISAVSGGMSTCVYKSVNGGASWSQLSSGVNLAGSYDGTSVYDQGDYDLCISINPSNPDIVFIGNVEMCRTVNGSSFSFVRKSDGPSGGTTALDCYTHLDIHVIKFAPSNQSVIYAGCDGGVYKSTNGGQSFFHVNNGINSIQMYTVASHPFNSGIVYGGAQDNGGFSTQNSGATAWTDNVSGDGMKCFIDYSNPDIAFIATVFGTLNRTMNGGVNWSEVLPQDMDSTSFKSCYWQHPLNPNVIYGAYKCRIIKSTDKGNNWFFTTPNTVTNVPIYDVTQSKANPNNMMLITRENPAKVLKSSNEGYNWTDISANGSFSGAGLSNVVADPVNASTFYILRGSYALGQILKTTNFGANWTDISSDLPRIPCSDVFIDTANDGVMYLGNDFGVYRTTNSGTNWARLNNGMPYVPVIEFSLFNNNGTRLLRAGTYGRGVFELNIVQTISVHDPSSPSPGEIELMQNYPNPFNPFTRIDFNLRKDSKVSLAIYDMTGKEIERLLNNEFRESGIHSLIFNSEKYSAGVYFYKLTSDGISRARKMILLK